MEVRHYTNEATGKRLILSVGDRANKCPVTHYALGRVVLLKVVVSVCWERPSDSHFRHLVLFYWQLLRLQCLLIAFAL